MGGAAGDGHHGAVGPQPAHRRVAGVGDQHAAVRAQRQPLRLRELRRARRPVRVARLAGAARQGGHCPLQGGGPQGKVAGTAAHHPVPGRWGSVLGQAGEGDEGLPTWGEGIERGWFTCGWAPAKAAGRGSTTQKGLVGPWPATAAQPRKIQRPKPQLRRTVV